MRNPSYLRKRQRSPVFIGLLLFQLVLVILQLWLFVSALEGLLAGERAMIYTGAIVSCVCLGVNIWMLLGVEKIDRES